MERHFNCARLSGSTYVLDDHDEEGKLDGKSLLGVHRAGDVVGADVGSHDLEDRGLNIGIRQSLDVAVANLLIPDLEGLGAKSCKQGQISLLLCIDREPVWFAFLVSLLTRSSTGWRGNRSGKWT